MWNSLSNQHYRFYRELRETLMRPLFLTGLGFGVVFLVMGMSGIIETGIFPMDALSITGLSLLALILQRAGFISQANNWFIVGFLWAVAFNIPHYGVNHPVTALYLPIILLSGLLIGRIFQATVVVLCSMFIPIFALLEFTGRREPAIAMPEGNVPVLIGSILFWVGLMVVTGWLVRIFAANLEAAVAASRSQTLALASTVSLLRDDLDPQHVFEQVVSTTATQLQVEDATLFLYDETNETLVARIYYVKGDIRQRADITDPTPVNMAVELPLWQELHRTKRPIHVTDIANDARLRYRARLLAQGVRTILIVPLLLEDDLIGMLSLNSHERRPYLPEEVDLAQALVGQIALSMQLSRLKQTSRETAIIRERNRMAREIHDTLAQGFTGVIVQLEAAEDVLTEDPLSAIPHLQTARQVARDSLKEARRSVMALRPQSLENRTLPEAIEQMVATFATPAKPTISFKQTGVFRPLIPTQAHHLLRITQEALTNAQKYAAADSIQVHLCYDDDTISLYVEDDGRGFIVDDVSGGFGLIGMRERADLMKATFTLNSQPDQGTQINVRVSDV